MKARTSISFYINGKQHQANADECLLPLSDYLRRTHLLTGTKVVCAEGDCGACTALVSTVADPEFRSVNTCILPVLSLDGAHLVTVEGLRDGDKLHPVQTAMIKEFGSQCGFCTPGFVCAMAALAETAVATKKELTERRVKNALTGNLCRCTGYEPIIKAGMAVELKNMTPLAKRYRDRAQVKELTLAVSKPADLVSESAHVFLPTTTAQATAFMKKHRDARIIAGATDLGVQVNKGRLAYRRLMSLQNIAKLHSIGESTRAFSVGARVTLTQLQVYLAKHEPEFDRMLNLFASPQIKNAGTLVGNVVNASPIADSIPFLMAVDAVIVAESAAGKRKIPISDFYLGYKKLALKAGEFVTSIEIPKVKQPSKTSRSLTKLYKVSVRKDLDISAVTMALRLDVEKGSVKEARIVFGGVGPVVKRLTTREKKWRGAKFERSLFTDLAKEIETEVSPIADVRGSREYRLLVCRNLLVKAADEFASEKVMPS